MDRVATVLICSMALCCYEAYELRANNGTVRLDKEPTDDCPRCLHRTCVECDNEALYIDLREGFVSGYLHDVHVTSLEPSGTIVPGCFTTALVKATFNPDDEVICHDVLRIEMMFEKPLEEWLFDFGDSISNNGDGGDYGDQYRNAEMVGWRGNVRMFGSGASGTPSAVNLVDLSDAVGTVSTGVDYANVSIANEYFKFKNDRTEIESCHPWLFALNGQSDSKGPVNYDVHLAFNRVVGNSPYRIGMGTCSVRISWLCPC